MTTTVVGVNDPKAVKRWSASLAVDTPKNSYWGKKFTSRGPGDAPVQEKLELESSEGDRISFDLSMQLRQRPVEGDAKLEGRHENLRFYTDTIYIDQMRGAVSSGGRMTRKRTLHDLRVVAKARASEWWGRLLDELHFMYASGSRGINADYILGTDYAGFAGNPIQAPDGDHQMFGGSATSKASLTNTDVMTRTMVERAKTRASMLNAINTENVRMQPIKVDGGEHFVVVMSPYQAYTLRVSAGAEWLDIQKAAAGAEGRNNPIFKGGLGMINNCVLHEHEGVIRFSDYGAGANLPAARALFLGAQGMVIAYGNAGKGQRFNWTEEMIDFGNELVAASNLIFGLKKTRYNDRDFGTIALDTYAVNPN